jgi:hypothetical protein
MSVSQGMDHKSQVVTLLRTSLDADMNFAVRLAMEICVLNGYEELGEEVLLCAIFMRSGASASKLLVDKEPLEHMLRDVCRKQPPAVDEEAISKFFLDRTRPDEEEILRTLGTRKPLDDRSTSNVPWVQLNDELTLLLWEAIKIAALNREKAGWKDFFRAMTFHEDVLHRLYRQRGLRFIGIARLLGQS